MSRIAKTKQAEFVMDKVFAGRRDGFFVEMGALDGIQSSNTILLERDLSWRGICIEPNPRLFSRLVRNRDCRCVMACVDEKRDFAEFRMFAGQSGIIAEDTDQHPVIHQREIREARRKKATFTIPTVPLVDVLAACDAPALIEYFSLDVEGAEFRVLGKFPWERFRFGCLTIERPLRVLNRVLMQQGYHFVERFAMDCCYVHDDFFDDHRLGVQKGAWKTFPSWVLRGGRKRFVGGIRAD